VIERAGHLRLLRSLLARHPVVAIVGARQAGKTTLARRLAAGWRGPSARFDLEDPRDLARLADPMLALDSLRGLVILDEIQRLPDVFPILRVLADRPGSPARFLVLGSASPDLLRQTSESLAGRIIYHEMDGFWLDEVGPDRLDRLWLRGGLPRSFVAASDAKSAEWRRGYVRTFLERDLPQLGVAVPSTTLRRFWSMLAHAHGQLWNASEFGRSFGLADTTVRRYLDLLTGAFAVRRLLPWHENIRKRQVKAPKVYVADSGILHTLLDVTTREELDAHPKVGASWEGLALSTVVGRIGARPEQCFFWRTHQGAELDLLVMRGRRRFGFEFKRTAAPSVTPSMRSALADLRLERLDVIHAGAESFPLGAKIRAVALCRLLGDLKPLR
jgi:predicted AAA+ superfamily ATPase